MFTAKDDALAKIPVVREPYPDGEPGIQKSLEIICKKIREGAPTAIMRSFAGNVLKQAGFPRTNKERATIFLEYVRKNVGYAPDVLGTEQIQSAAVSLCVDGAPVCIPIADCDDLVVALGTIIAAAGMEVEVVRQYFGPDQQQHVLVEAKLEDGSWFALDPSSQKMPAGEKVRAMRETRCSPWDGKVTGLSDQAEFVGIGALPVFVLTLQGWKEAPPTLGLGDADKNAWWYEAGEGVMAPFEPARPFGEVEHKTPCCQNCAEGKPCSGCGQGLAQRPELPFQYVKQNAPPNIVIEPPAGRPVLSTAGALAAGAAIVGVSALVAAGIRAYR